MSTITTIKLQKRTKYVLDNLKDNSESYDAAIRRIISSVKNKNLKADLIEAYKGMGKKDLGILEEWDKASGELKDYG